MKEKRFAIKSLKDRIQKKFNVSIAEVGDLEKWQRASLGMAFVTNEKRQIDRIFDTIHRQVESRVEIQIIEFSVEVY